MIRNDKTRITAATSLLILASILATTAFSNAEAKSETDRMKIDTFLGRAVWDDLSIEAEGIGTITTIELTLTDSEGDEDTNEVFVNLGRLEDGELLQGRTHDDIVFEIDKKLDTAKLNAIDVDICVEGDLHDNCDAFEQITIEVEWQGIGDKIRSVNPDVSDNKEVQWAREAAATGTIDEFEIGTSDDGRLAYDTIKGVIAPCC